MSDGDETPKDPLLNSDSKSASAPEPSEPGKVHSVLGLQLPRNPDSGKYIGILSMPLGLLAALFLANVADVGWIPSAILYITIFGVSVWTFAFHAVPHRSKTFRYVGALIHLVFIGWIGYYGTRTQYRRQHSLIPDLAPRFEVRLNDSTNLIDNGVVIPVRNGAAITFWVYNFGPNSANNLTVEFLAPVRSSNVVSSGWETQPPPQRGTDFRSITNETHWLTRKENGELQGKRLAGWGTAPLIISTNVHNPVFDRMALEDFDFVFVGTNLPSNFLVHYLPVELIVSSDGNGFMKRVFFLDLNNDSAP